MKVLLTILFVIVGLTEAGHCQSSTLTGVLYDAYGAVIPNARVTAIDSDGKVIEARVDDDGRYKLLLPYKAYTPQSSFKMTKYQLTFDASKMGFKIYIIKDFNFVPAHLGKMQLDIALDSVGVDPCHDPTACMPIQIIDTNRSTVDALRLPGKKLTN